MADKKTIRLYKNGKPYKDCKGYAEVCETCGIAANTLNKYISENRTYKKIWSFEIVSSEKTYVEKMPIELGNRLDNMRKLFKGIKWEKRL